jgi:hypothetical protein
MTCPTVAAILYSTGFQVSCTPNSPAPITFCPNSTMLWLVLLPCIEEFQVRFLIRKLTKVSEVCPLSFRKGPIHPSRLRIQRPSEFTTHRPFHIQNCMTTADRLQRLLNSCGDRNLLHVMFYPEERGRRSFRNTRDSKIKRPFFTEE